MSDDRTIALRSQTPPDVAELAGLIKAMLPNGKNLTDQEAIAGAMYGKAHNLDPFKQEYYIVPGRGIFPGYRGEMRLNERREYYTQTRPLRSDEAAEHEIQPGDTARIVELYQPDLMRQMRTLGITYQPIMGLGIVRKAEKQGAPPTGRSWAWKAEQRALKDAMRHMQGGADILDETIDMKLADAEHNGAEILAEVRDLPPAEQQAQFTERVNTMRGAPEHNPFDDNPPADTVDAEFERIPTAQQERNTPPAGEAPATALQVQRMGILASKIYGKDELESVFRPWLRENYGVDSRKALTTAQAGDVIAKLEAAERALDTGKRISENNG